jgi:hypothetical protein
VLRASFVVLLALLLPQPAAAAVRDPYLATSFAGLGAWVDIFDAAPWADPEGTVAELDRRGVSTLYLQTASSRPGPPVFRPDRAARFLRSAHARGMDVVAWYLPPYIRPDYEYRRALGAIRYMSPAGDFFDAFALDIETAQGSPTVPLRNRRLLDLSRALRRAVGAGYPLGAITPSPHGLDQPHGRRWWPDFPYRSLNRIYDAFLPMGYYTYHGEGTAVTAYDTRRNFEILREKTGDPDVPIHLIGGGGGDSNYAEGRAFTRTVNAQGAIGASIYDLVQMGPEDWRALRGIEFRPVSL